MYMHVFIGRQSELGVLQIIFEARRRILYTNIIKV